MKVITVYELLGLVKEGKAPKKIKIDDSTLFLSKIDGIRYRFEKCGSLNWDYYIETDRLDAPVEILDKDFKLEEEKDIEEIEVENGDIVDYDETGKHYIKTNRKDRNIYINKINELVREVRKLKNK